MGSKEATEPYQLLTLKFFEANLREPRIFFQSSTNYHSQQPASGASSKQAGDLLHQKSSQQISLKQNENLQRKQGLQILFPKSNASLNIAEQAGVSTSELVSERTPNKLTANRMTSKKTPNELTANRITSKKTPNELTATPIAKKDPDSPCQL